VLFPFNRKNSRRAEKDWAELPGAAGIFPEPRYCPDAIFSRQSSHRAALAIWHCQSVEPDFLGVDDGAPPDSARHNRAAGNRAGLRDPNQPTHPHIEHNVTTITPTHRSYPVTPRLDKRHSTRSTQQNSEKKIAGFNSIHSSSSSMGGRLAAVVISYQ
jgi:hypothetical protein